MRHVKPKAAPGQNILTDGSHELVHTLLKQTWSMNLISCSIR
jgi:hypothetical protein